MGQNLKKKKFIENFYFIPGQFFGEISTYMDFFFQNFDRGKFLASYGTRVLTPKND